MKNIYENWRGARANLLTGMAATVTGVAGVSASASANMNIPAVILVINQGNAFMTMSGCLAAIGVAVLGGIALVASDICDHVKNRKTNIQNNQRQAELAKQHAEWKAAFANRLANTEVIKVTGRPAATSANATPRDKHLS